MAALHKALHIERVVIVTPSVYGTDNRATLEGIKFRGDTARGVAVIDDKTSESDLDAMGKAGIKGIRVNLATGGVNDPSIGRKRLRGRHRSREGTRLACSGLHQPAAAHEHQGCSCLLACPGRIRPFRRRGSSEGSRTAGLGGARRSREGRQDLCENLRRLSPVEQGPRLPGCCAVRPGADRRQPRPPRLGIGLAASEFRDAARQEGDRSHAALPDRRRPRPQPVGGLDAGRDDPQKDSGRQSDAALRI